MGFLALLLVGGLLIGMGDLFGGDSDETDDEEMADGEDTVIGTPRDDVIIGTSQDEVLLTGEGNDSVRGGGGDDLIGDGVRDRINVFSSGDDSFFGGAGDDTIKVYGGSDILNGGTGRDLLDADELDPTLPDNPDTLQGGPGDDTLIGDDGDAMWGDAGTDFFNVIVDDASRDAVVRINDYEAGEAIKIDVYDPTLIPANATTAGLLRDTDEGAILSISNTDVVLFSGAPFEDVAGNVTVIDWTK